MTAKLLLLVALVLAAFVAGCGGPFVLAAGGALEGSTAAIPDSWSFTDEVGHCAARDPPRRPPTPSTSG